MSQRLGEHKARNGAGLCITERNRGLMIIGIGEQDRRLCSLSQDMQVLFDDQALMVDTGGDAHGTGSSHGIDGIPEQRKVGLAPLFFVVGVGG